ncbi:30S ribosomal protein S18 [Nematostella vectensis]|uniref:30S ribosomal protein S18 n=1 Tax=Nematostella vectensis TaxID=45351 RepID=UPI0020774091|nr:30S ribosomal protein S18 [Nematostella vectensis]
MAACVGRLSLLRFGGERLPFMPKPTAVSAVRQMHITPPVFEGKYHYLERKRKLRKEREQELMARYERLDEEDRPTGCLLCPKRTDVTIDYKNVRLLSQFISSHSGRIYNRRVTGLCDKKQKEITNAIKRARAIGLMPVTMKHPEFHNDPKLF